MGSVEVGGIRVDADPLHPRSRAHREQIRQIRLGAQMVFQEFNLFPHMRVIDNLIEAPDPGEGRVARPGDRHGREVPRQGRPVREARRVPGPAVRRPEAARGDRPRPDDGAQGAAVRRADLGPRPDARRRGAQRHGGARPRGRDHDRRHPRDGVRPRGGRPRLLHRGGQVRRGRSAGAGHRRAAGPADPRVPGPHARDRRTSTRRRLPDPAPARRPGVPAGRRAPRIIPPWPRSPVPTSSTSPTSPASG